MAIGNLGIGTGDQLLSVRSCKKVRINMFHKALRLRFLEGTSLELTFQDGYVKRYDISRLFAKYPQLRQLKDRKLFLSGKLTGVYIIVWNDDLDIGTETVYKCGKTIRKEEITLHTASAEAVARARALANIFETLLYYADHYYSRDTVLQVAHSAAIRDINIPDSKISEKNCHANNRFQ